MKCLIDLSETEDKTLQQLSINHKHRDIRTRAVGVMLLGRKTKLSEIAATLGVSGPLYNWATAWHALSLCGLLVGHKGGRPRALSEDMIATAAEAARSESMTLKQIAQQIEAIHEVPLPCGLDTLSVALKRVGFSYKRGRYSLKKNETNRSSLRKPRSLPNYSRQRVMTCYAGSTSMPLAYRLRRLYNEVGRQ